MSRGGFTPLRLIRTIGLYVVLPIAVVFAATYTTLSLPAFSKPSVFDLTVAYTGNVQGYTKPCG